MQCFHISSKTSSKLAAFLATATPGNTAATVTDAGDGKDVGRGDGSIVGGEGGSGVGETGGTEGTGWGGETGGTRGGGRDCDGDTDGELDGSATFDEDCRDGTDGGR